MVRGVSRRALLIGVGASMAATAARAFDIGDIGDAITILGTARGRKGRAGEEDVDISGGLKAALQAGTVAAVERVGQSDGYWTDKLIHIALPGFLKDAQTALSLLGQSALFDDLELRLNRGAEMAAPHARSIFIDAIKDMTIKDAGEILSGGDTAATDYFEEKMTPPLRTAFHPIVARELENAGAIISFNQIMRRADALPGADLLGESAKDELIDHGLDGALAGLFHYIGEEEKKIRHDPAARTSAILREVFG